VLAVNVNDPGRIAYQSATINLPCNGGFCSTVFPAVPTNHRLVVQHFSGQTTYSGVPSLVIARLLQNGNITVLTTFLPPISGNVTEFDQPVLVYFDAGQSPEAITGSLSATAVNASFSLTGYLLDCTIAPCTAIAQ
jgi:hypothetical protein